MLAEGALQRQAWRSGTTENGRWRYKRRTRFTGRAKTSNEKGRVRGSRRRSLGGFRPTTPTVLLHGGTNEQSERACSQNAKVDSKK